tara:strand:+ start:262 stop:465 length:204 start_codon:yes stop_codon:yes gene_type:complete
MEPTNEDRLNKVIDKLSETDLFLGVADNDTNIALGIVELMKKTVREYNQIAMEDYIDQLEKEHLTKL